jgi:hypothetical protein
MASIDEQIAALQDAIADGVKKVVIHSAGARREIEYHSLKDMREALAALQAQKTAGSRIILAAF